MSTSMSADPERASTPLLAVDTGGTFTDLVLLFDGTIRTLKVPSTPHDPSQAVIDGIREILGESEEFALLHGSTVATNALLERRGARVILVTNEGFEDVIEIGRQDRPQLYALVGHRPPPLVDRDDRIGIPGRLGPQGEEIAPLDEARLANLADEIRERDAQAVAVSLLHSYANADHERAVADAIVDGLKSDPLPVSVSSDIVPEFREFERTSTTVLNAYVAPVMDRYLGRLAREAGATRGSIMGSNGGALPIERARREPVHTVLSGPAGGVVGALAWARRAGFESVLSFDMGGTSTDVSLCPGRPLRTREFSIGGQPAAIPVIDIHTVGAGGGSIARVDTAGRALVGPDSAGARPGPACYGHGGQAATVTDANVQLGRLHPDTFGAKDIDLSPALAAEALMRSVGDRLGLSAADAARGVAEVVDENMTNAARVHAVENGKDLAGYSMIAFGGGGPLHASRLLDKLGLDELIVPPDAGVGSAVGFLRAPFAYEAVRSFYTSTVDFDVDGANQVLAELAEEAMAFVRQGTTADVTVERQVAMRYKGQGWEIPVRLGDTPFDEMAAELLGAEFTKAYEEFFGRAIDHLAIEAVSWSVRVASVVEAPEPVELEFGDGPAAVPAGERAMYDPITGLDTESVVVERSSLESGGTVTGPAVIVEAQTTTVLASHHRAVMQSDGTLLVRRVAL